MPEDPPSDGSLLTIVVDSNNGKNGATASCEVGANWTASNNVTGYYGTGYWWRKTGAWVDLVDLKAKLASPKKMRVEAWWPAACKQVRRTVARRAA